MCAGLRKNNVPPLFGPFDDKKCAAGLVIAEVELNRGLITGPIGRDPGSIPAGPIFGRPTKNTPRAWNPVVCRPLCRNLRTSTGAFHGSM